LNGYVAVGRFLQLRCEPNDKELSDMTIKRKYLLSIALAAMMGVAATPGVARTVAQPPAWSVDETAQVSAARAAALRECNARVRPYIQRIWGVTELEIYRACMAEHHQPA
jgi:hypothetical protein